MQNGSTAPGKHKSPSMYGYATALREWTPLAEQGNTAVQVILGSMYEKGQGVPQDDKIAVKWFQRAAEQGDASAQYNLGWLYASGQGVPQDNVYAHMWANLAAANGANKGAKLRGVATKQMTLTQIAEAQKLARECLRKKYKGC